MLATIQIRKQINGVEMEVQSDSKIIYQVQRMDGCWYIAGMRAIYDKDALIPVYPASGISMDKEKLTDTGAAMPRCLILWKQKDMK